MKKTFKKAAIAAALLVSFGVNATPFPADPFWFDADGAGSLSAFRVGAPSDINTNGTLSVSFAYNYANPFQFDFTQNATGYLTGFNDTGFFGIPAASAGYLFGNPISYSLSGNGVGTLGSSITFTSGTLTFGSIAKFNITGGGALINAAGIATGATEVDLTFDKANSSAGYFFTDINGVKGTDWTLLDIGAPVFSLVSSYLSNPSVTYEQEGPFPRPETLRASIGSASFYDVPEPASLALTGLGLLGLGALRRRKAEKAA